MFKNIDDPWAYSVMMLVVFGAIAFAHLASEKTTAWKNEREEKARQEKEKARAKASQKTNADKFYDDFPGDD
jgi:membrane protein involved in colicin uptake